MAALMKPSQTDPTPMKSAGTGATILIVEDNDQIRKSARLVLEMEGFSVVDAADGQDALDRLTSRECRPDLIVSDILMPRLDGYAFFEAIRRMPEMQLVPFIFLTAYGSRQHVRLGRQLGVDDYLVKPFDAEDLVAAVKNKLQRVTEFRQFVENEFHDSRRAIVSLLSHELRTPLTYVTGGYDLLSEALPQDGRDPDVQVSLQLIHNGTQRLNRVAEQTVRYGELISGFTRYQLDKYSQPIYLEWLVKEALVAAEGYFAGRQVEVATRFDLPEPVQVLTVSEILAPAIYEVLRNAATFSQEGGRVEVEVRAEGQEGVITVRDFGRGIRAEDKASIWEIMTQSDRARHEQQGTGMGLPIAQQTVLLHGGSISLESEWGQGTVVTIRLPLAQAS